MKHYGNAGVVLKFLGLLYKEQQEEEKETETNIIFYYYEMVDFETVS